MTSHTEPKRPDPSRAPERAAGADPDAVRCGTTATVELDRSLRTPSEARAFIESQLCPTHARHATAAVALVASEFVTDTLRSSGDGPITVSVECEVVSVTVRVTADLPAAQSRSPELHLGDRISSLIVNSISVASGTEQSERGSTMWSTISSGYVPSQYVPTRRSDSVVSE